MSSRAVLILGDMAHLVVLSVLPEWGGSLTTTAAPVCAATSRESLLVWLCPLTPLPSKHFNVPGFPTPSTHSVVLDRTAAVASPAAHWNGSLPGIRLWTDDQDSGIEDYYVFRSRSWHYVPRRCETEYVGRVVCFEYPSRRLQFNRISANSYNQYRRQNA
jgi:hypothetical protein